MSVLRVTKKNKVRTARTPKRIEVLLRETARKDHPVLENVNYPLIALQNPDESWSSTTEISWHFPEHQTREPKREPRRSACAF